ncbi:MAG TPA: hypothetical protein VD905_12705 [Flavobacteriales bacterium]|nr:hypothetical protein [Flavobacteriales bacterium]
MAAISYEYISLEFGRKNLQPVTEQEYELLNQDIDAFMDAFFGSCS